MANPLLDRDRRFRGSPESVPRNVLPVRDRFGRIQVGGPLGGHAGALDTLFDIIPGVGDYRAAQRLTEAARPQITPNLMGGASVGVRDPGAVAMEGAGLLPVVGDIATAAKVGGTALAGLVPLMARSSERLSPLAQAAKGQRGIIGSTGAKTADLEALETAQTLKSAGADADTIFNRTGWWLDHPDGRPRFEIDDSGAAFASPGRLQLADEELGRRGYRSGSPKTPDFEQNAALGFADNRLEKLKVGDAVSHDKLAASYPSTLDMRLKRYNEGTTGGYATNNEIGIRNRAMSDPENRELSTALHELQHAIQSREGMAQGGSPKLFSEYTIDPHDLYEKVNWDKVGPIMQKYGLDGDDLGKTPEQFLEGVWNDAKKAGADVNELASILDERFRARREMNKYRTSPYGQYFKLAGEAEARLVQDRMNLTPAERAARPFYREFDVPLDEQIVRMDYSPMR